jgi:hypothetical protein
MMSALPAAYGTSPTRKPAPGGSRLLQMQVIRKLAHASRLWYLANKVAGSGRLTTSADAGNMETGTCQPPMAPRQQGCRLRAAHDFCRCR